MNDTFTPSLDTFITGTDGYGGIMSQEMFDSIQNAFHYISISLCGLLFVVHIGCFIFSAGAEKIKHWTISVPPYFIYWYVFRYCRCT